MTKLNELQKEFIIDRFFTLVAYNDTIFDSLSYNVYNGYRRIAKKLIDNGSCIVAGNTCIWHGGIGNFIRTETIDEAIDCLKYIFDIDEFMQSMFYKDEINQQLDKHRQKYIDLLEEAEKAKVFYEEIEKLKR